MYEQHFSFTARPFSAFPEPGMIYWAEGHKMAHTMLSYGMSSTYGVVAITGEIGCGKTTLLERLCLGDTSAFEMGRLEGQFAKTQDLPSWVLYAFGREYQYRDEIESLAALKAFLQDQANRNRKAILFIDEAQLLEEPTLEGLRLIADRLYNGRPVLQLVLLGQPELGRILNRPSLQQLRQRVVSHYHLKPLQPNETSGYIRQRLIMVGGSEDIFDLNAIALVHQESNGVPRAINIICDTALVYAFSEGHSRVTAEMVSAVIDDRNQHGLLEMGTESAGVLYKNE